jgi:hypothetical protein
LWAAIAYTCLLLPSVYAADNPGPGNDYQAEQENKKDAVDRVVDSHDFTLVLGVERFYLK